MEAQKRLRNRPRAAGQHGGSGSLITALSLSSFAEAWPLPARLPAACTSSTQGGRRCAGLSPGSQSAGSLGGWFGLLDRISHGLPTLQLSATSASHPMPCRGIPERIT